jgi:hypothetical protein
MKQTIRDTIQLAVYKYDDLEDQAVYIGSTLDRLYKQSWQTFVFDGICTWTQGSSTNKYYNHWAFFTEYGPNQGCYYVFK